MSIGQLRRRFKSSLLGVGLVTGIGGCGWIDQPPVAEEAVPDARGVPIRPTDEQKARLQWMHNQATVIFIKQPGFGNGRLGWPKLDYDIVHAQKPDSTKNPNRDVPNWFQTPDETPLDKEIVASRGNFNQQVKRLPLDNMLAPLQFRQVQLIGLLERLSV